MVRMGSRVQFPWAAPEFYNFNPVTRIYSLRPTLSERSESNGWAAPRKIASAILRVTWDVASGGTSLRVEASFTSFT